jgi:hypothetical protein
MVSFRLTALAVVVSAGLAAPALASFQDNVTIFGELYAPDAAEFFELAGQSAYLQQRTSSSTTGGQLDGLSTGGFAIGYAEVFPEANLTDYLTFGYFGVVNTYASNGDEEEPLIGIVDTSIVFAMQPGVGEGQTVDQFTINNYDEATLVAAFTGSFDSPEFLDVLGTHGNFSELFGTIGLPQESIVGDTLDLIAFIGGPNGDEGVKIGELNTSIERIVPAPGAAALFTLAGLVGISRRR